MLECKRLEGSAKVARLLRDFLSFGVDVAVNQETHFVCDIDTRVLFHDIVLYSA